MKKEDRGHPTSLRHDFLGWNYRMSDLQGAVALEQTERIDEIVNLRMKVGKMFLDAVADCPWLIPQYTPDHCVNSYWTFVCRFEPEQAGCSWDDFRNKFWELGGDFLYGAWQLTYKGRFKSYEPGLCPVAEKLQPKLMQFKTNYTDLSVAEDQAGILKKTIDYFTSRKAVETQL
jgi:perosamine synthetase